MKPEASSARRPRSTDPYIDDLAKRLWNSRRRRLPSPMDHWSWSVISDASREDWRALARYVRRRERAAFDKAREITRPHLGGMVLGHIDELLRKARP